MVDNDVIKRTIHDKTFAKVIIIDTKVVTGCKSCLENTILLWKTKSWKKYMKDVHGKYFLPIIN